MTDVSVIVVSFNAAEPLARCLASVDEGAAGVDVEVVVVDNASTDDAVATARRVRPDARVLPLDRNVGFGPAVNHAARQASGRWLLLLNPDAEVQPGAIATLVRSARAHPEAGFYGGVTLGPDGRPDGMHCWGLPTLWSTTCFGLGLSALARGNRWLDPENQGHRLRPGVHEVDALSGAFLLVDHDAWHALAGFDEDYFLYAEDLDLCARGRALGYRCLVVPEARVAHAVGGSSAGRGPRRVTIMKGKVTYLRKHWGPLAFRYGRRMLWLGAWLRRLLAERGRGAASGEEWRLVWARRRDWLAGYPVTSDAHRSAATGSKRAGARPTPARSSARSTGRAPSRPA